MVPYCEFDFFHYNSSIGKGGVVTSITHRSIDKVGFFPFITTSSIGKVDFVKSVTSTSEDKLAFVFTITPSSIDKVDVVTSILFFFLFSLLTFYLQLVNSRFTLVFFVAPIW